MSSEKYILGIDPGNLGSCALLSLDGKTVKWFKIPTRTEIPGTQKRIIDGKALLEHLENFNIVSCYIEKQEGKNPKLIANYGICVCVLQILDIDFFAVPPASWTNSLKRRMGMPELKQNSNKVLTFTLFKTIFPDVQLPKKGLGLDDDVADSCLLAWLCYLNIESVKD